jgi:hypothetical protein
VAREPADRLPVRRHSGPESVRDPNPREAVRHVQRYRVGLQQVGQGSGAHSGRRADLHPAGRTRQLAVM